MLCMHKIIGSSPITSNYFLIMLKTYQINPIRINLSYQCLTKFDNIDNLLTYKSYQFNSLHSTKTFIQLKLNSSFSKIDLLAMTTLLELLTQQRVLITNLSKVGFSKSYALKTTIRKSKLLIFLDLCLPTIFLTSISFFPSKLIFKLENINQKLHVFSSNKFVENLNLKFSSTYFIQISNYLNQESKLHLLASM